MPLQIGPDSLIGTLSGCRSVLLTGPTQPDGDSLGACLALQRVLRDRGVACDVTGAATYRYDWMPSIGGLLSDEKITGTWEAVVVLDGDRHRLTPNVTQAFETASVKGIVDHHASTTRDGYTHFWLDAEAGSTCEMVYAELAGWGVDLDRSLAEVLYTGLIFDTGAFRYSNTTPATHEMAAKLIGTGIDHAAICLQVLMDRNLSGLRLAGDVVTRAQTALGAKLMLGSVSLADRERFGIVDGDLEGIVESLIQVHGVEVGVLFIEHPDAHVKLSLRSRGTVNVAAVARSLASSGGGHAKAAGVRLPCGLDEARTRTIAAVTHALNEPAIHGNLLV